MSPQHPSGSSLPCSPPPALQHRSFLLPRGLLSSAPWAPKAGPLWAPGHSGQHFLSPRWACRCQAAPHAGLGSCAPLRAVLPKLKLWVKSLPEAAGLAGI